MFLQHGVTLLKDGGSHGHIVPTTILNNVYAENLRRWLLEQCSLCNISVAKGRVFEDADVHTSVLILRKESDHRVRDTNDVLTTAELSAEFDPASAHLSRTKQHRFRALPGVTWNILLNERNAALIHRLTDGCDPLEKIATINRGLITGDRAKYFAAEKINSNYVLILTGADVQRYSTAPASEYVRFVRPKRAGGCWDREVHLAPHKLVIRQIGTVPTASHITEPIAVTGNLFTARASSISEERYLLAILNSKLIAYFWRTMFADFKTSFPQVTIFSLSQVPVRRIDQSNPADRTRYGSLVALVDKMLALMPKLRAETRTRERAVLANAVQTTEQKIDELVYELYGLTQKEIALVEGASK